VQYLKQSEKDPHYLRRLRRRGRKTKEKNIQIVEKLLESDYQLLGFRTDDEKSLEYDLESDVIVPHRNNSDDLNLMIEIPLKVEPDEGRKTPNGNNKEDRIQNILEHGFRMVSNPSSPRFVPISNSSSNVVGKKDAWNVEDIHEKGILEDSLQDTSKSSGYKEDAQQDTSKSSGYDEVALQDPSKSSGYDDDAFETDGSPEMTSSTELFHEDSENKDEIIKNSESTEIDKPEEPSEVSETMIYKDEIMPELAPPLVVLNGELGFETESCSPPSSGRSEPKGNSEDADEDTDGSEKRSRVSSPRIEDVDPVISKIMALKEVRCRYFYFFTFYPQPKSVEAPSN